MRFRPPFTVLIIWSNIQCSVLIWRTVQCKNIHSVYHHTVCNMRQLVDIHVIITLHSTSYFCTVHTVHCEAVGGLYNMNYRMHCVVIWSRVCIVYCHIAHCAIWEYTVCNVRQLVDSQWLEEQSPATMECPHKCNTGLPTMMTMAMTISMMRYNVDGVASNNTVQDCANNGLLRQSAAVLDWCCHIRS